MGSGNLGKCVLVFYGEGLHRWMGERCTVQIGAIRVEPVSVVSLAGWREGWEVFGSEIKYAWRASILVGMDGVRVKIHPNLPRSFLKTNLGG